MTSDKQNLVSFAANEGGQTATSYGTLPPHVSDSERLHPCGTAFIALPGSIPSADKGKYSQGQRKIPPGKP